jgi:hypothetical protein
MSVPGKIEIIDLRTLEGVRLLRTDVRCEEENLVAGVARWQIRLLAVQLLD